MHSQFSLTCESHVKNVCTGLSSLQQNGEFVDMTLAADGHLVKVHQVILALASPYIKDLISSAQCQHPVIFLNKISYITLSSLLEYVYTGEVLVSIENLRDLIEAGKDLRIKGLEDMQLHTFLSSKENSQDLSDDKSEKMDMELCFVESNYKSEENNTDKDVSGLYEEEHDVMFKIETKNAEEDKEGNRFDTKTARDTVNLGSQQISSWLGKGSTQTKEMEKTFSKEAEAGALQYTVSNQGSLQMILNRYMYYLKYTNRNRSRQWRCVDYLNQIRCPAHVVTMNDVVIQRIAAHTHPFHDKRILKKLRTGAIFSAIVEAEREGDLIKQLGRATNVGDGQESE